MSYWVSVRVASGPGSWLHSEDRNITYNLTPMMDAAGCWLKDLDGMSCVTAAQKLADGLGMMESDPTRFQALAPPNGWGTYEGALEFMRWLLAECRAHPFGEVSAS